MIQRLLTGLPPQAAREVAATSNAATFRPGETIMGSGRPWLPAVVADGTVRLTMQSSDGREATLRFIQPGVIVGLLALFEPDPSTPVPERRIVAVERSTVIILDPATLSRLGHEYSEFAMYLARGLVSWSVALGDAAGRFAFMNVRQRVAAHLLGVAKAGDGSDAAWVAYTTQQQLADAIGSVREVVARSLHDLRAEGVISVSRKKVTIVDRPRLMRTVGL